VSERPGIVLPPGGSGTRGKEPQTAGRAEPPVVAIESISHREMEQRRRRRWRRRAVRALGVLRRNILLFLTLAALLYFVLNAITG